MVEKNFKLIEKTIEKIDSISCCKFVINEKSKIEEIHIISNGRRAPKQISRDVQSVLIASYCLDVDYKKISIAEISEIDVKKVKPNFTHKSLIVEKNGKRACVKVVLSDTFNTYEANIEGINTKRNIEKMIVETTLRCIELACGYEDKLIFEDIRAVQLSTDQVLVVIIVNLEDGEEKRLSGSSIIESDFKEAIVNSTLDAAKVIF